MSETNLVQNIRLSCNDIAILWRNNVGCLKDRNGRLIQYGLCIGSSDLIGIRKYDGRFIAIECKVAGKKPTPEQENFIRIIRLWGGLAGVATTVEEARKIILQGL